MNDSASNDVSFKTLAQIFIFGGPALFYWDFFHKICVFILKEQSPAFQELLDDNAQIRNNNIQIREDQNAPIDFMTFAQFLEGILIHLRSAESAKYRLRWSEQGEDHISPLFAILQPCHYPFQNCEFTKKNPKRKIMTPYDSCVGVPMI